MLFLFGILASRGGFGFRVQGAALPSSVQGSVRVGGFERLGFQVEEFGFSCWCLGLCISDRCLSSAVDIDLRCWFGVLG